VGVPQIRHVACGPATFAVSADNSAITWGGASNGELGYGAGGKKSSANPAKSDPLEGWYCHQVAAGVGFTVFLMDAGEAVRLESELVDWVMHWWLWSLLVKGKGDWQAGFALFSLTLLYRSSDSPGRFAHAFQGSLALNICHPPLLLTELPVFEPLTAAEAAELVDEEAAAGGGKGSKRKAPAGGNKSKKK